LIFNCLWASLLATDAVGAAETRHGEWTVIRLRPAAHGTANIESLSLGVGPRGGLGEHGDSVSRLLVLTNTSLVARRPENYEVHFPHYIMNHLCFLHMDMMTSFNHIITKLGEMVLSSSEKSNFDFAPSSCFYHLNIYFPLLLAISFRFLIIYHVSCSLTYPILFGTKGVIVVFVVAACHLFSVSLAG
jgi:uncharacterized membrane protein (DUF485 family)